MMGNPPSSRHQVLSFFPFALASILVIGAVKLYLENSHSVRIRHHSPRRPFPTGFISPSEASVVSRCNVFDGKWVFDNATLPLYREQSCPYLTKQVTCRKNGRPDSLYQNWRWEPNGCKLPRWVITRPQRQEHTTKIDEISCRVDCVYLIIF